MKSAAHLVAEDARVSLERPLLHPVTHERGVDLLLVVPTKGVVVSSHFKVDLFRVRVENKNFFRACSLRCARQVLRSPLLFVSVANTRALGCSWLGGVQRPRRERRRGADESEGACVVGESEKRMRTEKKSESASQHYVEITTREWQRAALDTGLQVWECG